MTEVEVMIDEIKEDEPEVPEKERSTDDSLEQDCVGTYLRQIGEIPLLTPEEEVRLFQEIKAARIANEDSEDGAQQARLRVVEGNLRFVVKIAMRYRNLGLLFLDLIQEGNIGLMKAVEKFKPEKGYRFTTYATWWIQQNMMRALTDQGRTIRLPAHIVERLVKLEKGRKHLQQRNNAQPTIKEIADKVSLPVEKVKWTLEVTQNPISLDAPFNTEEEKACLMDLVQNETASSPEDEATQSELLKEIEKVLGMILPREAEIIRLRFGLDGNEPHTLEQIGTIFGITRERIRQIEEKALKKLRHPVRNHQLKDFWRGA